MRRQGDDPSAGVVRISEKIAVWIYSASRGVKPVCRLYSFENFIPIAINDTFNCRARNYAERRSNCHDTIPVYSAAVR
jgi:hypothetical protein